MSQFFESGSQSIGVSASVSVFPMNISFRIDWCDLHNSKASILQCSAFFMIQLSHPYVTTGKKIAFTGWTFVGKVISLPFNTLSRFGIAVLPRNKCLLISWLQ